MEAAAAVSCAFACARIEGVLCRRSSSERSAATNHVKLCSPNLACNLAQMFPCPTGLDPEHMPPTMRCTPLMAMMIATGVLDLILCWPF